jgi:Na+/proline symporter
VDEELTLVNQRVRRERKQESPMRPVARITTIFLALVALAQFLRLVLRVEVTAGGVSIPLWASLLACVFTGGLSIMLWRENKR